MRERTLLALGVLFGLLALAALIVGCRGEGSGETRGRGGNTLEGAGFQGTLRLHVAEPLRPIVDRQVAMFRRIYPQAEVVVTPTTTREAYVAFVRQQTDAVVVDREPNAEERDALGRTGASFSEVPLGYGALVAAVHPSNNVASLTAAALGRIASGQAVPWSELGVRGTTGNVGLALASLNTGAVEGFTRRVLPSDSLPRPAYAAQSEADALSWVAQNPAGLAIVSMAAYAAQPDESTRAVAVPDSTGRPVLPTPFDVYAGRYPLRHPIILLVARRPDGIGAGFATFARGTQGQEAVQRAGLAPYTLPAREIQLE